MPPNARVFPVALFIFLPPPHFICFPPPAFPSRFLLLHASRPVLFTLPPQAFLLSFTFPAFPFRFCSPCIPARLDLRPFFYFFIFFYFIFFQKFYSAMRAGAVLFHYFCFQYFNLISDIFFYSSKEPQYAVFCFMSIKRLVSAKSTALP